jgi:hypothetical protein
MASGAEDAGPDRRALPLLLLHADIARGRAARRLIQRSNPASRSK